MNPLILAYLLTAIAYGAVAAYFWRSRRAPGGSVEASAEGGARRSEQAAVLVALGLHSVVLYHAVLGGAGLRLGVGNALSIIAWLSVLIYWVGSFAYRLEGLQALISPFAAVACLLPLLLPPARDLPNTEFLAFKLHILISMAAYGFFTVASLHMFLMALLERRLHGGRLPALLIGLPPLLTMEKVLFRLIGTGFVLLTFTLASGILFSEELFGRPMAFNHKTVFGVLSWAIFAALLAGRRLYGWRGRVAMGWTLAGFAMLILAYIGSRFVLEVILQRAA